MFGYSKQAYYQSQRCQQKQRSDRRKALNLVGAIRYSMPMLGTRKLHYLLKEDFAAKQLQIGRDKLFSILREEGLLIPKTRRYTKTTNSKHWMRKYPNQVKRLEITRPEQVWVSDITYVNAVEGFQYLHLVTDAYSKQIMGYKLSPTMSAADTAYALKMAINNRQYRDEPLIHHSDRGLQYCSDLYTGILKSNRIEISMTEQSDPYENAVAERVNGVLKQEFGLGDAFDDIAQLHKQTDQAINLYNNKRPHMSNGMLTPKQMHGQKELLIKKYHKKTPAKLSLPALSISSN